MNQPDLFDTTGFAGSSPRSMGARQFTPRPTPPGCARVLLRCTRKGCKFCKAADIPQTMTPGSWGGTFAVLDADTLAKFKANTKCTTHPTAYLESSTVEGTVSESHKCDPRCTSAIGPICQCQCGGANHGAGWL